MCIRYDDDKQYRKSADCDVHVLKLLSHRVHYFGRVMAKIKLHENFGALYHMVAMDDVYGVCHEVSDVDLERKEIRWAYLTASTYGEYLTYLFQDSPRLVYVHGSKCGFKLNPSLIAEIFFRDMIIPMTKDVTVRHIFRELNRVPHHPDGHYYMICAGTPDAFDAPWEKDNLFANLYI